LVATLTASVFVFIIYSFVYYNDIGVPEGDLFPFTQVPPDFLRLLPKHVF